MTPSQIEERSVVPCSRRHALALLAAAALAGCSKTPEPTLYTLVPRPGAPVDRPVASIVVRPVVVAKYLDRPEIVRRPNPYEITVSEFVRWGEALDAMATRVLVADLALRLPTAELTVSSSPIAAPANTVVAIDIARFDPDPGGPAILEARWAIRRGEHPGAVHFERISVAPASGTTIDLVAAMSDCLAQLSDRLALALAAPG